MSGASGVRSGQTASGNESVHRDSAHTSRKEEGEEKSGEAAKTEEKVEEKAVVAKTAAENMAAEDRPTATLLDMSVTKQVQSMTPSKNGKVPADPSIEDAVDGKSANGAASKPSGDTVAKGATCDESDDEEQDAEGNPIKAKNKKKDEGEDALAKILKAVQDMRAETTSALKEVQETVEDLEGRVAKSEEDTRVVAAKLKATIPSVAASEDPPQRRSMKRAFVTDTAFQRDIQTSA